MPLWARLQPELREQGIETEPVPVVDDEGAALPETLTRARRSIARHGLVLATGHLAPR